MSDQIEHLRERLRELEMDAVLIRGRTEELREIIALLEPWSGPRRGRPRKPAEACERSAAARSERSVAVVIVPKRVEGAAHEPECDEQGELPSIDAVRGILKGEERDA